MVMFPLVLTTERFGLDLTEIRKLENVLALFVGQTGINHRETVSNKLTTQTGWYHTETNVFYH